MIVYYVLVYVQNLSKLLGVSGRGVTRALIWGVGAECSYIRVLPDGFLLKSVVFKFISKEIS